MNTITIISIIIGTASIILNVYFGIKQIKMKKAFIDMSQYASQSQSICKSMKELDKQITFRDFNVKQTKAKLEAIYDNMAALNGEIQRIYKEYFKRKSNKF